MSLDKTAKDSRPSATAIRIEFSDGHVLSAQKEAAEDIWNWWIACESMACIHGAQYKGRGTLMMVKKPGPRLCVCGHKARDHALDLVADPFCEVNGCKCKQYKEAA